MACNSGLLPLREGSVVPIDEPRTDAASAFAFGLVDVFLESVSSVEFFLSVFRVSIRSVGMLSRTICVLSRSLLLNKISF